MDPAAAFGSVFTKPFTFSGRASRSEFWWFLLMSLGLGSVLLAVDMYFLFTTMIWQIDLTSKDPWQLLAIFNPLNYFYFWWLVISFFPTLSVTVRRLHDAGFSGAWLFLQFLLPIIGQVVVWIICALPSDPQDNAYGNGPYVGNGQPRPQGTEKSDPLQAYAALFEMERREQPEFREAMEERRKAEVRALYEQRILGRPSEA